MVGLTLSPVENSPFESVVDRTIWDDHKMINRLRVAEQLGFLVQLPDGPFKPDSDALSLVMYGTESPDVTNLTPPIDLRRARERQGSNKLFGLVDKPFDADTTAKGLGSKGVNVPEALPPKFTADDIVARKVVFSSLMDFYRRDQVDARHGSNYLLARHLGLLARAVTVDTLTRSDRGTLASIAHMERDYGDKRLVIMDTPPSWQLANKRRGIEPAVPPKAVLVRGGPRFTGNLRLLNEPLLNRMTRIGVLS